MVLATKPKVPNLKKHRGRNIHFPVLDFQEQQEHSPKFSHNWRVIHLTTSISSDIISTSYCSNTVPSASRGILLSSLSPRDLEEFWLGRRISQQDRYLNKVQIIKVNRCHSANKQTNKQKRLRDKGAAGNRCSWSPGVPLGARRTCATAFHLNPVR